MSGRAQGDPISPTPPSSWAIADITDDPHALGRARFWVWVPAMRAWLAVGVSVAYSHEEFAAAYPRAVIVRGGEVPSDALVATLRTPLPVNGLADLAADLCDLYGERGVQAELEILPFGPGEFAKVVRR